MVDKQAWCWLGRTAKKKLSVVGSPRAAFPSRRQKRCIGLKPHTYPDYVRQMVDYDYADKLSEEERVWLSAFSEEYYKGWRMKDETQVNPLPQLRESNAAYKRLRLSGDPVAFPGHRDGALQDHTDLALTASGSGRGEHELRGRNTTEDEMIRLMDRPRLVK